MPIKSPEYRLSPMARDDMEALWLSSFKQWGIEQTERYIDKLTDKLAFCRPIPKRVPLVKIFAPATVNLPSPGASFITVKRLMA